MLLEILENEKLLQHQNHVSFILYMCFKNALRFHGNYQQQIQQQNETCRNAELSFLKTKQKQFEPLPSTVFIIIFIPPLLEFSHSNYI